APLTSRINLRGRRRDYATTTALCAARWSCRPLCHPFPANAVLVRLDTHDRTYVRIKIPEHLIAGRAPRHVCHRVSADPAHARRLRLVRRADARGRARDGLRVDGLDRRTAGADAGSPLGGGPRGFAGQFAPGPPAA